MQGEVCKMKINNVRELEINNTTFYLQKVIFEISIKKQLR